MGDQDKAPPRKHLLDFVDVAAKIVLSIAAVWAAYRGAEWNRDANERNGKLVSRQTDNQLESLNIQKDLLQIQMASSMMPYFNCKNPLSKMALNVLQRGNSRHVVDAANALLLCARTPTERAVLQEVRQSAQQREIQFAFFQHLENAYDYAGAHLYQDASHEFYLAYMGLPVELDRTVEPNDADKALQAYLQSKYEEAVESFKRAFSRVPQSLERLNSAKQNAVEFFQHLSNGIDYLRMGSDAEAAREYEAAYAILPFELYKSVDHIKALKARKALSNEEFDKAAQLFASAFEKISLSGGSH